MNNKIRAVLASNKFFYACLGIFALEALWIALSAAYSMPFDENTHLAAIQLFATHWLPFWTDHSADPANLGAISRNPSYLYYYLMAFPYRLVSQILTSEMSQVIYLRMLSITFFGLGLVVYRKLLLKTKASKSTVNIVMAFLVLTPITPFLAAQINYDNLLFLMTGCTLLLAMNILERHNLQKPAKSLQVILLVNLLLLTSIVKLAFVPIMVAIVLWIGFQIYRHKPKKFAVDCLSSFKSTGVVAQVLLILLTLISAGLFTERYGVNLARYHKLTPDCTQVLEESRCWSNGPWARDQKAKLLAEANPVEANPVSYTVKHWLRIMSYQMFFTLNTAKGRFDVGAPLPIAMGLGLVLASIGTILILIYQKTLRKLYVINFLIVVSVVYVFALWRQEYLAFKNLGQAVAIQSRYLIVVLPIFYLLVALAFEQLPKRLRHYGLVSVVTLMLIFLTQGGGATPFIIRSNPDWYWPKENIISINQNTQKVLRIIIIAD